MPKYSYKAKKGPTEIVQGELEAENDDAALGQLAAQGLIPVKLERSSGAAAASESAQSKNLSGASSRASKPSPPPSLPGQFNREKLQIPRKDFDVFTRQFAILMKASVPLLRIFSVLMTQTTHPKFRWMLQDIQEKVRSGSSLSDALRLYPRVFSPLYINMMESGEISGTLDIVLIRLSEFSEKEAEIRSRIQSALIYPVFLLLVGIITVFVLLTFILPRLMDVFTGLGNELPAITMAIIHVSEFCQKNWLWMMGAAAGVSILMRRPKVIVFWKQLIDPVLIRMPVFGDLIRKSEITKFLRSLELLYENGIPLYRAVEVSARTVENTLIQQELEKLSKQLQGGSTLTQSLEQIAYVSSFVTSMISVGEESGKLTEAIQETASFYEKESAQTVKIATALIEPFMILVIGGIIGFIVVAMLLPVFEIQTIAH